MDRLRSATCEAHRRLEGELDVVGTLSSPVGRRQLVRRYRDMYCGAETLLDAWLAGVSGLGHPDRTRTDLIARDLRVLGVTDTPVGVTDTPGGGAPGVEIASVPEALGFLYVVEGSALGGRVILRELGSRGVGTEGLSFLDPHGAGAGEAWRRFVGVLEREVAGDAAALDQAVSGAVKGFAHARACLSGALAGS